MRGRGGGPVSYIVLQMKKRIMLDGEAKYLLLVQYIWYSAALRVLLVIKRQVTEMFPSPRCNPHMTPNRPPPVWRVQALENRPERVSVNVMWVLSNLRRYRRLQVQVCYDRMDMEYGRLWWMVGKGMIQQHTTPPIHPRYKFAEHVRCNSV